MSLRFRTAQRFRHLKAASTFKLLSRRTLPSRAAMLAADFSVKPFGDLSAGFAYAFGGPKVAPSAAKARFNKKYALKHLN